MSPMKECTGGKNELLGIVIFIVIFRIHTFLLKNCLKTGFVVRQNTKFSDQFIIEAICNYPLSLLKRYLKKG